MYFIFEVHLKNHQAQYILNIKLASQHMHANLNYVSRFHSFIQYYLLILDDVCSFLFVLSESSGLMSDSGKCYTLSSCSSEEPSEKTDKRISSIPTRRAKCFCFTFNSAEFAMIMQTYCIRGRGE